MDLDNAIAFINRITSEKAGRSLRPPEITIIEGTWKGLTYAQMADESTYSTNYLMRDIGPKFWRLLSDTFGEPISKTNIRVVLSRLNRGASDQAYSATTADSHNGPWVPSAIGSQSAGKGRASLAHPIMVPAQDWANLTSAEPFYGRQQEIIAIEQWLTADRCRLLGLWGLSGIGKTALLRMVAPRLHDRYDRILWRSLQYSPRLQDLLASLPGSTPQALSMTDEEALLACLKLLQSQSFLLILDDVEGILDTQQLAGRYPQRYSNYGEFLQRFCTKDHNSCLVVAGLEPPRQILRLHEQQSGVNVLQIQGLPSRDALCLLEAEKLTGADTWSQLIDYYQGHPLGLQWASKLIRELFHGNTTEFFTQNLCLLDDIRHLLEKTVSRLSSLELDILYFLATSDQSASLALLQTELAMTPYPIRLIEALDSLKQRSLLKTVQADEQSLFTVDTIVKETVIKRLIGQVSGTETTPSTSQRYRRALGTSLRLTPAATEMVKLSDWLKGHYSPSWQAITALFVSPMKASLRLRSTYQLRDKTVIKRFKQIRLGAATDPQASVILLVAINRESDQNIQVCIQSQPDQTHQLPPGLTLCLLDSEAQMLAQVSAGTQDSFIQLPYFSGGFDETFSIQLQLNGQSHIEEFLI